MIMKLREKKETGFSLLELSVAVGVSAIVATAGIVATTAFIGSAQDKRDSYTTNANSAIENAEASSLALGASGIVDNPVIPSNSYTLAAGDFANGQDGFYGGGAGSAIGYIGFTVNNAELSADLTPTTSGEEWLGIVTNPEGSASVNLSLANSGPGNLNPYFGGEYSTDYSGMETYFPDFSYNIQSLTVSPSTKTITFVLVPRP